MSVDQDVVVDKKQPTWIRVEDYYEPEYEATVEYSKLKCYRKQSFNLSLLVHLLRNTLSQLMI